RAALWRELALAEGMLRAAEGLGHDLVDLDLDGREELWVHSRGCSLLIAPHRGGAIEEYTRFDSAINYADVLTRREEGYHQLTAAGAASAAPQGDGAQSNHDIESGLGLSELPPRDSEDRVMLTERVLDGATSEAAYARGDYRPLWSIAMEPVNWQVEQGPEYLSVVVSAARSGAPCFQKRIVVSVSGGLKVDYQWDPAAFPAGSWFAPELSIAAALAVACEPAGEFWSYDITTVAKSERGLDHTLQGRSLTPRWPISAGSAMLALGGDR
ncbi:MAG TPA: alpha-amylase/4-alpha-glucanotransferase domain-containing protein, partial [Gemmatimonadales bacterium]|nr:alpha-amylase/4-alpha-glucanotransferase domain-containing protein [Gemmatimonadales bacterium]